ncbi:MAG: discoidin domain-containing protein, partial [Propionibacteriaceae bacterium]
FAALTKIVGTADAAPDLERRIRRSTRDVGSGASTATAPTASSAPTAMSAASANGFDDTQTTVVIPIPDGVESVEDRPVPFTPVPPPASRAVTTSQPEQHPAAPRRRLGPLVLIATVAVALAAGLTLTLIKLAGAPRQEATATATPSIVEHKRVIAAGQDFDPLGSKSEIPQEIPNAIDGDPATVWHTETYAPEVWNKKHAVGMYVDLGAVDKVNQVQLTVLSKPSSVQILVPKDSTSTEAPETLDGWTKVSEQAGIEGTVTLTFDTTPARYVLVWFTDLPTLSDGNLEGGIAEVVVQGP